MVPLAGKAAAHLLLDNVLTRFHTITSLNMRERGKKKKKKNPQQIIIHMNRSEMFGGKFILMILTYLVRLILTPAVF